MPNVARERSPMRRRAHPTWSHRILLWGQIGCLVFGHAVCRRYAAGSPGSLSGCHAACGSVAGTTHHKPKRRRAMQSEQVWQAALGQLQLEMPKTTFDTWVRGTTLLTHEDGSYVIGVNNAYAKDWLENRLRATIQRTLGGIVGRTVEVRFVVWTTSANGNSNGNGNGAANGHGHANGQRATDA